MMDAAQFTRLLQHYDRISTALFKHCDLTVHRHINHSYYLQRIEEMKILLDQLAEAEAKLELIHLRLREHYVKSFQQWRKDARWLSTYVHQCQRMPGVL